MAETKPRAEQLAEARRVMEGEEYRLARAAKLADLNKRRLAARQAMEGPERRERREFREKIARERQAGLEKRASTAAEAAAAKSAAAAQATAAKARAEAAARAAHAERLGAISQSESMINKLNAAALNLSPIRTYKSDLARAVQAGASVSQIALAEQERRHAAPAAAGAARPSHARRWLLLALILVGGGAAAYWWLVIAAPARPVINQNPPATPTDNSLVFAESNQTINLTGEAPDLLRAINTAAGQSGIAAKTIRHLVFSRGGNIATWPTFRQTLGLQPPDGLTRSLAGQFMFGLYHDGASIQRFLILKTNDYTLAYANLLAWERTMAADLLPLLAGRTPSGAERVATFADRLIRNKDIRVMESAPGQTTLLYAFLDPQTIVLATSETTFLELFNRYLELSPGTITQ